MSKEEWSPDLPDLIKDLGLEIDHEATKENPTTGKDFFLYYYAQNWEGGPIWGCPGYYSTPMRRIFVLRRAIPKLPNAENIAKAHIAIVQKGNFFRVRVVGKPWSSHMFHTAAEEVVDDLRNAVVEIMRASGVAE
jgi:hypothetical protein